MGVSVSDVRAVLVRVRGRVQGVGFRWYVMRTAKRLALAGWVRNADDGSVEVGAQGASAPIEELLAALRRGPPSSVVQSVEVDERPPATFSAYADFEIMP